MAKDPTGVLNIKKIQRPLPGFNLAGRPGILIDQEGGREIKALTLKICRPLSFSTINTDSQWTFVVQSNKKEFIRFFANSLTCSLYSVIPTPDHDAASANPQLAAVNNSTRSLEGTPTCFLDPSVMGTSLVKSVRVTVNGVPVQSNQGLDPHLLHYVRCSRIFNSKPEPYLAKEDSIAVGTTRINSSTPMKTALRPFDHYAWNNTRPNRIPIFLDGIWPFDHRNRSVESIDRQREQPLYLPPDTRLEITVELHRDKMSGVFHDGCHTPLVYFRAANAAPNTVKTTIEDVLLEYESCELSAKEHEETIRKYRSGEMAYYDFDQVHSQVQNLDAGVAYSIKHFQIQPHCRLVYLLFLPNHAVFSMPNTNKPISAWSRFPAHCTEMNISFAGESDLITQKLENFGVHARNNEISKKIFYDYLTSKNLFNGPFEELFGGEPTNQSLLHILPVDLKHLLSAKTERLSLELKFSGADLSPDKIQIMCLSVHINGRAVCSADQSVHDWKWEFKQL